jgi:hypothetical protein
MPFKQKNKLGAKKFLPHPLGKQPICFRGYEGQKEQLKAVPNWQERLRQYVAQLIAEGE